MALGMPRHIEILDGTEWVDEFVDAVDNRKFPSENDDSIEATVSVAANLCRGRDNLVTDIGFDTNDVLLGDDIVAAFPPEVNPPNMRRRGKVVVFDDFNNVTPGDCDFMFAIYRRMADHTPDLMSFIITSQEEVANKLLDMNAWIKMAPLPGTFVSDVHPTRNILKHHFLTQLGKCSGLNRNFLDLS